MNNAATQIGQEIYSEITAVVSRVFMFDGAASCDCFRYGGTIQGTDWTAEDKQDVIYELANQDYNTQFEYLQPVSMIIEYFVNGKLVETETRCK